MRKIILIPGNPGLIKMYDSFLDILHKLQNREIEILGVSHANHFISKKCNRVYNLEEQIHQKIKFMQREIRENDKQGLEVDYILIGHSIGCQIILKMLQQENILHKISKAILLYPTIERMKQSPQGRSLSFFFRQIPRIILITLFRALMFILPDSLNQNLLCYLSNGKSDKIKLKFILKDLIDSNFLYNVFFMAHYEMKQVSDQINYQQLKEIQHKLILYYGSNDKWTPHHYIQELKHNLPQLECYIDQNNIDHAFVLNHSVQQAQIVNDFLNKIFQ